MVQYKPVDYSQDSTTLSQIAKESLDKKLHNYRLRLEEKCRKKALQEAVLHVDSLIIKELKLHHKKSVSFPQRPTRPKLPEDIILDDSTTIEKF